MCNAEISKAPLFLLSCFFFHARSVGKPKMVLFASHQAPLKDGGERVFANDEHGNNTGHNESPAVCFSFFFQSIAQTSLERWWYWTSIKEELSSWVLGFVDGRCAPQFKRPQGQFLLPSGRQQWKPTFRMHSQTWASSVESFPLVHKHLWLHGQEPALLVGRFPRSIGGGGRWQNWSSAQCNWNFPLLGETPSYHPSAFLKCLTVSGALQDVG